ncbi:MAG: SPFH domain-containing protein [Clostridia bacterium]|nr:SPFH domain-containing protein [Clostridia bacterium]
MGLIKAAVGAVGSTLHDQWKEAIRCEDMGNDILMIKKTTPTGVISNGSTVIVAPDQCAIIYDNGRIVDATAEGGVYTFDTSSSPSLFAGQFGGMFKEMWERFTYNGATAKEQAVYFINIKEIIKNKFGTPNPVVFKDWGHPVMNPRTQSLMAMKVGIRCFGTYTFKINDPFLFMSRIAGTATVYRKDEITEQMRSEVIASFSNIMNSLGDQRVEAMDLPQKTDEIKQIMDENVFDEPIRKRGIALESFAVESVTFDEKSEEKIDTYEIGGDAYTQQGTLVNSYANAVEGAAKNSNGAMNGFMGIGMMNMATNGMVGGATQGPWQQANNMPQYQMPNQNTPAKESAQVDASNEAVAEVKTESSDNSWECPNCHTKTNGNFCPECGAKKPEAPEKRFCSNCGNEVKPGANFCSECGTKVE